MDTNKEACQNTLDNNKQKFENIAGKDILP